MYFRLAVTLMLLLPASCFGRSWEDKTNERLIGYQMWLTQAESDYQMNLLPHDDNTRKLLDRAAAAKRLLSQQFMNYKLLYNGWGSKQSLNEARKIVDRDLEDLDAQMQQVKALYRDHPLETRDHHVELQSDAVPATVQSDAATQESVTTPR